MILSGNERQMVNILLKVHTRSNLQGVLPERLLPQFGKQRRNLSANFFAWILLHQKILTANNLTERRWLHDLLCKLRDSSPEMPTHLCLVCPFAQAVWAHVVTFLGLQGIQHIPL
jgi:hypothetical protein